MAKIEVAEKWIAQAYQHGRIDECTSANAFESEDEAIEYAKNWCREIPFDEQTEHEMVVAKVVCAFRGRPNTPYRSDVE